MMNLEEFLAAGHTLVDGDKYSYAGRVYTVGEDIDVDYANISCICDDDFTVISAKCLNTKTEYVKVGDISIFDLQADFEDGKLFFKVIGEQGYGTIITEAGLIRALSNNNVYSKTERPLEKWEQVRRETLTKPGNIKGGRVSLSYKDFDTLCKELSK